MTREGRGRVIIILNHYFILEPYNKVFMKLIFCGFSRQNMWNVEYYSLIAPSPPPLTPILSQGKRLGALPKSNLTHKSPIYIGTSVGQD